MHTHAVPHWTPKQCCPISNNPIGLCHYPNPMCVRVCVCVCMCAGGNKTRPKVDPPHTVVAEVAYGPDS